MHKTTDNFTLKPSWWFENKFEVTGEDWLHFKSSESSVFDSPLNPALPFVSACVDELAPRMECLL